MKKLLIPFLFLLSSCSVNKYLSLECKDYDTEEKILTLNVDLEGDKVEAIFPNQNGKTIFVKGEKYFNYYDPEIDDFPKSEKLPEKGFINIKLMDYQNKDKPKGTNYIYVNVDETKDNWHFFQKYQKPKRDLRELVLHKTAEYCLTLILQEPCSSLALRLFYLRCRPHQNPPHKGSVLLTFDKSKWFLIGSYEFLLQR